MKHVAFTGTQRGMTPKQLAKFFDVISGLLPDWFHHGDCVGADAQAHDAVRLTTTRIHVHPCTLSGKRAWCAGDAMSIALPPLDRNRVMVDESVALIATPKSMVEELRSGTWATIRYARKRRIPVHLIFPDGAYIPPPPRL